MKRLRKPRRSVKKPRIWLMPNVRLLRRQKKKRAWLKKKPRRSVKRPMKPRNNVRKPRLRLSACKKRLKRPTV